MGGDEEDEEESWGRKMVTRRSAEHLLDATPPRYDHLVTPTVVLIKATPVDLFIQVKSTIFSIRFRISLQLLGSFDQLVDR